MISIVVPVFMGESSLDQLAKRVQEAMNSEGLDYELILVNDASPDKSWNKIIELAEKDSKISGINLSKNFGQHPAIFAGCSKAKGSHVVVMDCDLQDEPENIPGLFKKLKSEDLDIVYAKRKKRKDSFFKVLSNWLFYSILSKMTDLKLNRHIGNFGIYSKPVIEEALRISYYFKTFSFTVRWLGFKSAELEVEHSKRFDGKSSYTLGKLFKLGENIALSYSNKPLRLSYKMGFFISFLSFFLGMVYIALYLIGYIEVPGFASIILSIWLLGGLSIFFIGVIGLYLEKVFEGSKGKPFFIISEETKKTE